MKSCTFYSFSVHWTFLQKSWESSRYFSSKIEMSINILLWAVTSVLLFSHEFHVSSICFLFLMLESYKLILTKVRETYMSLDIFWGPLWFSGQFYDVLFEKFWQDSCSLFCSKTFHFKTISPTIDWWIPKLHIRFCNSSKETDISVISMEVFRNFFWGGHNVPLRKIKVCVRYIE